MKREMLDVGDSWQNLANYIVLQAATDYRRLLKSLAKKDPFVRWPRSLYYYYIDKVHSLDGIENFFCSEWFKVLSPISGKYVMNRIRSEVDYERVLSWREKAKETRSCAVRKNPRRAKRP